ncbi:MAG: hypothetical protein ABR508_01905 [Candidatus Baltobacteraceae bacterium]
MNTRTLAPALLAAGMALVLAACGSGSSNQTNTGNTQTTGSHMKQINPLHKAHNEMTGKVLNVNMGAMNSSKQDGSASVGTTGNGLSVVVKVFNEPKGGSEPAHIHRGTCKNLDPVPWKPLAAVVNGASTTHVAGVTLDQIKKGHYAINVHDQHNLKRYVSCGDLST